VGALPVLAEALPVIAEDDDGSRASRKSAAAMDNPAMMPGIVQRRARMLMAKCD
jgi:hypothetical protein